MAKVRENHRNKKKTPRVYTELDLSQFKDILTKPDKYKGKGSKKPYKGNKQGNTGNYGDKNKKQRNK